MNPLVELALAEDIGNGDITTNTCVRPDQQAKGIFLTREPLVLAGTTLLTELYENIQLHHKDGEALPQNTVIATVQGNARTLLERERTALNFLQHLSGIATLAQAFAQKVAHTNCKILDTRKTTPGFRHLEKSAAASGGITNHRMGLYDAILIKNNHITAAGGIRQAIAKARTANLPIEIEVRTPAELEEALEAQEPPDAAPGIGGTTRSAGFGGVTCACCSKAQGPPGAAPNNGVTHPSSRDSAALTCACSSKAKAVHLLLDNLTPQQAKEWIALINKRAKVELSGGITLETVQAYAETGADFISVGAITHSARAVDISFRLELL